MDLHRRNRHIGHHTDILEPGQRHLVGLDELAQPHQIETLHLAGHDLGQRDHTLPEDLRMKFTFKRWDRTAIGRQLRRVQQHGEPLLDGITEDMLQLAGLLVHDRVVESDDVRQHPLGQPVLAHHLAGTLPADLAELNAPVVLHRQQPIALQPGHGLAHGRTRLMQPLDDPRT